MARFDNIKFRLLTTTSNMTPEEKEIINDLIWKTEQILNDLLTRVKALGG